MRTNSHTVESIYAEVRKIHKKLWAEHRVLIDNNVVDPLWLFDPKLVAQSLGFDCVVVTDLGQHSTNTTVFETAGVLDRRGARILISAKFNVSSQRFTAAHEIGHLILHPNEVMHRDRAIDAPSTSNSRQSLQEREADQFASMLLMPDRLVAQRIQHSFGRVPFVLDDITAQLLTPDDADGLFDERRHPLARAHTLASARRFGGKVFPSLAEQFGVSKMAMAIRIKELGLVAEWP